MSYSVNITYPQPGIYPGLGMKPLYHRRKSYRPPQSKFWVVVTLPPLSYAPTLTSLTELLGKKIIIKINKNNSF